MTHQIDVDTVATLFKNIAKVEGVDPDTGMPKFSVFNLAKKKRLVNLTDETIFLADEKGTVVQTLEPVPLDSDTKPSYQGDNVVFIITKETAKLIISGLQKTGKTASDNVVIPDTGKTAIRNEQGEIVAIRCFTHYVTGDLHTSHSLIGK